MLFETARHGIAVLHLDSCKVAELNPFLARLSGYDYAECVGRDLSALGLPQSEVTNADALRELRQHGSIRRNVTLRTKGGERLEVEFTGSLFTENGREAMQCDIREVPGSRSDGPAAETARDRFFTLSLDMLGVADLDGYLQRVNPAFIETLGFTEAELKATPFRDRVHPEDRAATLAGVQDLFLGIALSDFANRYQASDGSWRWLEWRSVFAPDEGLIYAAARDVTKRKEAEAALHRLHEELETRVRDRTSELEQANRQLRVENVERQMALVALKETVQVLEDARREAERANRAKDEFLSRMSHELRTPLNAVLGFGQLLESDTPEAGPDQRDDIQQILKAGRHLLDLVNEVLDISTIEAGHLSLCTAPIAVGPLVADTLEVMRPLAAPRHIRFHNEMTEGQEGLYVLADPQRFKQVLLNFLSNAVKYNREGGDVFVSCELTEEEPPSGPGAESAGPGRPQSLRIIVRDTGPGLAPSDTARLFVPFERLDATCRQIEGTGIGLALCKHLLTAMDGRIGVDSEVGRGSAFWMELPLLKEPSSTTAPPDHAPDHAPAPDALQFGSRRTILLSEDTLPSVDVAE